MSNIYIYVKVLELIDKGYSVTQIAKSLGRSKSTISYYLNNLYIRGYIQPASKYPKTYVLTEKGRFLLRSSKNKGMTLRRVERLEFVARFVSRGVDWRGLGRYWVDWGNGSGFYNLRVDDVSIQVFGNGRVLFKLPRYENMLWVDVIPRVFRDLYKAISYLYKLGIIVDLSTLTQVGQEYAFDNGYYDDLLKGYPKKAIVDLGRKAEGLFNKLNQEAKAWIDRSYSYLEVESNDLEYVKRLLLMPEIIYNLDKKLAPILEELSNQIRLHLEVEERTLSTLEKLSRYIEELRDLQRRPSLFKRILNWFRRWFG